MHAARQARVEAAHRPHYVDTFEFILPVLLEDRLPLDGVFVRTRSAVAITRTRVPGRRRVGMIVRDLALPNDHMVGQHSPDRLGKAAADRFLRDLEGLPGFRASCSDLV